MECTRRNSIVISRLQKLHNRASRIIAHGPNEIDQQTVLNVLGWELLKQQGKKAKAKMMFKTLNNMGPNSLKKTIYFQKGNFKPQSSWQFKFDTCAKAQYKQYEEKFYVRWSFHLELFTRKYK